MSNHTPMTRQQVLAEFKRRRTRELVAAGPFIAAAIVFVEADKSALFQISRLKDAPLLVAALLVIAACIVHHALNWRCPVCSKNFWTGIFVSHCKNCGTVFEKSKLPPGSSPVAERRAEVERAIELDLGEYRGYYLQQFLYGLAIVVLGLFVSFFLSSNPEAVAPDGWLAQKFGEQGAVQAVWGIGGLVTLLGLAMMAYAFRQLTVGVRRNTQEAREALNSEEIQRRLREPDQGG